MSLVEKKFNKIYKKWWENQVLLGNVPHRSFNTSCRCHPNINKEIIYTDLMSYIKKSDKYIEPNLNFRKIIPKYNNIDDMEYHMLDILDNIYTYTLLGFECFENVNNAHRIFWQHLSSFQRKKIINFVKIAPYSIGEEIWTGGWEKFSLIMCVVYQRSFDFIEIN
jgi:hypothetical protein